MRSRRVRDLVLGAVPFFATLTLLQACAEPMGLQPEPETTTGRSGLAIPCVGDTRAKTVECALPSSVALGINHNADLIGSQGELVSLISSNVSYDSGTGVFQFDVAVQNLMNEAIGTPDGTVSDPDGIQVFFSEPPFATHGTGTIAITNADGEETFLEADQKYFEYAEILEKNEVSAAKTWQMQVPPTVQRFKFRMYLETDRQYLLVINEVMVNPVPSLDTDMEWFEVYNAGSLPVDMQNLVIADSAASGRRPYHLIASSLIVSPGGYVVLGWSTNTTLNGGAQVDYGYGAALQLANSLDAVKIGRPIYGDTLTVDRTQYSNPGTSAVSGVSRELKNPALDNSNMDGSNWDNASVTAVYGSGGRGTPKAQNSTYTPGLMCTSRRFSRC